MSTITREFTKEQLQQIIETDHVQCGEASALARIALASLEAEPVAYIRDGFRADGVHFCGGIISAKEYERTKPALSDRYNWKHQPLYTAPPAAVSVPDEIDALRRDANRYRFLRDKDAFGNEDEHGLASWDDLADLEVNEFDAAVDARMMDSDVPMYANQQTQGVADAEVYAELYRLRSESKGPDGFETWKDAAIAERKARIELEKSAPRVGDIDYLGAMAAFHSDKWHKMDPITGYMHGFNACRAAMLQGADGNSPVISDGWVMVPVDMAPEMMRAVQVNSELGAYAAANLTGAYSLFREFWDVAVTAAPRQE